MSKWTKLAARAIGIDTEQVKISNHSHRSSTISHLAKAGVPEQTLIKMTGHSSTNSIKPYLQFDADHHQRIVENIRPGDTTNTTQVVSNHNSNEVVGNRHSNVYNNCTFNFSDSSHFHNI